MQSGTVVGPIAACTHHRRYSWIVLHHRGKLANLFMFIEFIHVYSTSGRQQKRRSEEHVYQMHIISVCVHVYRYMYIVTMYRL